MLVTDALQRYIEDDCEGQITPREVYRFVEIKHSWELDMPELDADDVAPSHLIHWRELLSVGRYHTPCKKRMSGKPRRRKQVERYCRCFIKSFRWMATQDIVQPDTVARLEYIRSLRKHEHGTLEPLPQIPVDEEVVMNTVSVMKNESARDLIVLMLRSGMRPSEAVEMYAEDIRKDIYPDIWVYIMDEHKTDRFIDTQTYYFGPTCQEIITRQESKKRLEKGPLFRNDRGRGWTPNSLQKMITRKAKQAGMPHWSPKQLRKTWSTKVAATNGLVGEAAVIGHTSEIARRSYVARDNELACKIAKELG